MSTKTKKILVTGGAGYIGSVLCKELLDHGYEVRVLDSLLYGSESIIHLFPNPKFKFQFGDIANLSDLRKALNGIDTVVHLAGIVGDDACARDTKLTTDINIKATRKIVQVAIAKNVPQFIFASSCSVYGAKENKILDENSDFNPVSLYAHSKIASEKIILSRKTKNFHPTILRFSTIYGYSPRTRFDLAINLFAMRAAKYGNVTVQGAEHWRPFIHVKDIARAIIAVIEAPVEKVSREVFNVGVNSENYKMSAFEEIIRKTLPKTVVNSNKSFTDLRSYHVSFDKIEKILEFKNEKTVVDGLKEIYDLVKCGLIQNPRDIKYIN